MKPHPCPEATDPLAYCGWCDAAERMAEERKEAREHGDNDSTGWQVGQDSYERYLDRMWE